MSANLVALGKALLLTLLALHPAVAENRSVLVDEQSGIARAVVVDDHALAHTAQLLPLEANGEIAAGDLDKQIDQLVENLSDALASVECELSGIARLNVYLSAAADPSEVQGLLSRRLLKDVHPAATSVVTPLADPRALVAVDAIAAVPECEAVQVIRSSGSQLAGRRGTTIASVLPRGRAVYISGMAERTDDLAAATTGTMKQLHGVLELLGVGLENVVHVKSFLKPIDDVAVAREAIRQTYAAGMEPAMTFVEWSNALPIEIEMIAYVPGDANPGGTVVHRWRPGEKQSPVYCRFAVVDSPARIYVSGLTSRKEVTAPEQVRDIFHQLGDVLSTVGSDMQHLVKATYYVADEDVSQELNNIRPEFYNPKTPPAASKASIAGTGDPRRTVAVDMIAVER